MHDAITVYSNDRPMVAGWQADYNAGRDNVQRGRGNAITFRAHSEKGAALDRKGVRRLYRAARKGGLGPFAARHLIYDLILGAYWHKPEFRGYEDRPLKGGPTKPVTRYELSYP